MEIPEATAPRIIVIESIPQAYAPGVAIPMATAPSSVNPVEPQKKIVIVTQKEENQRIKDEAEWQSRVNDEYKRNILPGEPGSTDHIRPPKLSQDEIRIIIPSPAIDSDCIRKFVRAFCTFAVVVGWGAVAWWLASITG